MLQARSLLAAGLLVITLGNTAEAHDLKVLASHLFVPKPGERTTVYLSWGHTLPVDDLVDAESLERYDLMPPGGKPTPLKKSDLSLQTNVVEIKEEGISQVVVSRKPAVFTFVEDKEGNRLMKRGPKSAITEGKIDYAIRSQQFAKALIVAGTPKAGAVRPASLPLEIVPLDGPKEWRGGASLRFRVLFQGKHRSGETLLATYVGFRPDNAWCYATTTDREGIATVRVSQAGTWVLKVNIRKPTTGSTRDEYDFESYTATLALEVRP